MARVRRRVEAQRAAGRDRGEAGRDRAGFGRADDDDVDQLVAVALGAEGQRALQALGARLARPHRLDGARVGGGDGQQAAGPAADDEQAVAGPQPAAVEGAQHAGQRLDEGRALGVEPVEHEQLADELGRHAHALGEAARVQGRWPGSARTASRGRGGSAGTRRTARGGAPRRDRRPRRRRRSAPTAMTSPASSWPSTAGTLRATHASRTSEPHTPQASTRQTTSPGPARGSGASSTRTSRGVSERATLMPAARRSTRRRAAARRPAR